MYVKELTNNATLKNVSLNPAVDTISRLFGVFRVFNRNTHIIYHTPAHTGKNIN